MAKRGRPIKISDAKWAEIKAAKIAGVSNKEICKDYGVSLASLMRFLDTKLNRADIVVGQGGTAFEIVSALTDAALRGRADAARLMLRRLGRG